MDQEYRYPEDRYILIGVVAKAQGLRGDVAIVALSGQPDSFLGYSDLILIGRDNTLSPILRVERIAVHKGRVVVKFDRVPDRTFAERLVGMGVLLARENLPALAEEEYYWHEITGKEVFTCAGLRLGQVSSMFSNGAQDIMVVTDGERVYLIPVTNTVVRTLLDSPLDEGIIRRARRDGQVEIHTTDIRAYALDRHAMTDDRPFGGGEGMVMKPEPLSAALQSVIAARGAGDVILMSPQGDTFSQRIAEELAGHDHLILICGRYEGVDERFRTTYVTRELSIGDYILTGGELAAMVVVDAVTRLLPGVLGCADSVGKDTFSNGLLKHPQYTRPRSWNGMEVPDVLLSGNHEQIEEYRFVASVRRTLERRPEMFLGREFTRPEKKLLKRHGLYATITALQNGADNRFERDIK